MEMLSGDLASDERRGWKSFEDLLTVHPVLLALVARQGLSAFYPRATRTQLRVLLTSLRDSIADVSRSQEWPDTRKRLLEEASEAMKVDSGFIEASLLNEARHLAHGLPAKHRNLQVALAVRALRRFIGAALLDDFARDL